MKNLKLFRILSVFLLFQWIFIQIISQFPLFVEKYYSKGIYPIISRFLRILFGWVPFSLGDLIYFILIIVFIRFLFRSIKMRRIYFLQILGYVSIVYFSFYLLWGLNYYRVPLNSSLSIDRLNYSTQELDTFTHLLIDKVNRLQKNITTNDSSKVVIPMSKKDIYSKVESGYINLNKKYPQFFYSDRSIKHSILSIPLTYMGFSGYLNPFTGEAQVNYLNPSVNYPSTSAHEVAHQLGYSAENEANFIGFLASIYNEDIYFQYSGYYMALRYVLNDLYRHDQKKYEMAIKSLNKGTLKNMKETYNFWKSYQNPIEPYVKNIFDLFLKANKQKEGIKSYSKMVGMLLNFNKHNQGAFKLLK